MKKRCFLCCTGGFLLLLTGCLQMPTKIHKGKSSGDTVKVKT